MLRRSLLAVGFTLLGCHDGAGGGAAKGVERRLDQCGLLRSGELNLRDHGELGACISECRIKAPCDELERRYCDQIFPPALFECEAACFIPTPCANGKGFFTALQRCDGDPACEDGSDEADCGNASPPRYCASSGERILAVQLCNGKRDCDDGTDEQNCPDTEEQFTCTIIPQRVPKSRVCDLESDCLDGSDEAAAEGCAQLICR